MNETMTQGEVLEKVYRDACTLSPFKNAPLAPSGLLAVAAHVRAEDAARGGTLHGLALERMLEHVAERLTPEIANDLHAHLGAQGRRIAVLEADLKQMAEDAIEEGNRLAAGQTELRQQAELALRERDDARRAVVMTAERLNLVIVGMEQEASSLRERIAALETERDLAKAQLEGGEEGWRQVQRALGFPDDSPRALQDILDAISAKPTERMLPETEVRDALRAALSHRFITTDSEGIMASIADSLGIKMEEP